MFLGLVLRVSFVVLVFPVIQGLLWHINAPEELFLAQLSPVGWGPKKEKSMKRDHEHRVLMLTVTLVTASVLAASARADLSSLAWTADAGTRITGPSGCVHPTFVMARPDGRYGMYFYDGDGWTFGDTGYATSTDGVNWSYQGRVMSHGTTSFDSINAVIQDVVALPGGRLRAYCAGMGSNQVPVRTSIFYTETDDPYGVTWSGPRTLLFPEVESTGCPRVLTSAGSGYAMYFYRGNNILRMTSPDGISNWSPAQVVVPGLVGGFDIVSIPNDGFRMFVSGGSVRSLNSSDGIAWNWDAGSRLTPGLYGQSSVGTPVLASIDGVDKMYVSANPDRYGVYSATSVDSATSVVPAPGAVLLGAIGLGFANCLLKRRSAA